MPTSPRPESLLWDGDASVARAPDEVDPIEAAQVDEVAATAPSFTYVAIDDRRPAPTTTSSPYTASTEYKAAPGLPGRGVIVASAAAALGCAGLDLMLTGGLSIFFDLCFVVICLVGAMAVRRSDLFTTGVLAPLMFGGVVAAVTFAAPEAFVGSGDLSRIFLTGLTSHAGALVAGYAVALATVGARVGSPKLST